MGNHRVVLGDSNLSVSPVCFGTWQLSSRFWGDVPGEDVRKAARTAFDLGVNFFDTADAYGDGRAEEELGRVLADLPRDDVVVCTKIFNRFLPDGGRLPDLSPAHVRERVEACLRRLGVETIDLLLLHMFDHLTPMADVVVALDTLRAEGKIRACGVSNHSVEQLRAQQMLGDFTVVQPPYSLVARDIEKDLLPYCQATRTGVMVYSPMHKGLLTGKYAGTETFADFRSHHPDFQGERFRDIAEAVAGLRSTAEERGVSAYQLVLAATLMHPAVHCAVVGIKTEAQIREAAAVMDVALDRETCCAVRKALDFDAPAKIRDAGGTVK